MGLEKCMEGGGGGAGEDVGGRRVELLIVFLGVVVTNPPSPCISEASEAI